MWLLLQGTQKVHANPPASKKPHSGFVCHYGSQAPLTLQTKNRRLRQIGNVRFCQSQSSRLHLKEQCFTVFYNISVLQYLMLLWVHIRNFFKKTKEKKTNKLFQVQTVALQSRWRNMYITIQMTKTLMFRLKQLYAIRSQTTCEYEKQIYCFLSNVQTTNN